MKYLSIFCFVVLLVLPDALVAEQVRVSCSNIADAQERLACFDRTFPSDAEPAQKQVQEQVEVQQPVQEPVQIEEQVAPIQTTPVVAQDPGEAEVPPVPASTEQSSPPARGGMFSKRQKVNISSRLKSVRDQDQQKMIFLLENDQIWIQNAPRSLPFAKGQEVTIKSGTIGGYSLSNSEGLATRVRRIK